MSTDAQRMKHEYLREALQRGWTSPALADPKWVELATPERLARWYSHLYNAPDNFSLDGERRLFNHFTLGADPEFIFMNAGVRFDARGQGLKAGLAFGADNNGRLVELRPEPSRSGLSVLTSIWLTMHWMSIYVPGSLNYVWRAGAYAEADGLGGHIHLGRKAERLRAREVRALDRITHLLYTAGVYDKGEGRQRFQKSQGGQYGHQGDIRSQPHGWEYRTLPSWLDTPWLAYLSVVLGKLAVASELAPVLSAEDNALTADQARNQIKFTLAYFKGVDDDARLALAILLRRGFPVHVGGADIKLNWGILQGPLARHNKVSKPTAWPTSVPSTPTLEAELAASMLEGRLPEVTDLKPTWTPSELPKGYHQLIHDIRDTRLMPGLGELAADVCYHDSYPVTFVAAAEGNVNFRFPRTWQQRFTAKGLERAFTALHVGYHFGDNGSEYAIHVAPSHGNLDKLFAARKLLMEHKFLPLWLLSEVRADNYKEWETSPVGNSGSKALSKTSTEPAQVPAWQAGEQAGGFGGYGEPVWATGPERRR